MIRPALAFVALAASASAQTFTYTLDDSASGITIDADVGLDLTGDLRGVWDATTNPSGTRTVPGVFGDPGTNERIPLTLGLGLDLDLGGAAAGGFSLTFDDATGVVSVDGLALTLGAGTTTSIDLELSFVFDTFRTFDPLSLFVGGIPLTIPLGSVDVTDVVLTQNLAGIGAAVPGSAPGLFDVTAIVPVELTLNVELGGIFGGGGGTTPVGPIPLALPLTGTFDLAACDTAFSGADSQMFDETIPPPFPLQLEDVPFDLPTILPPGETANLLLTVDLDEIAFAGTLGTTLSATATDGRVEDLCPGEANSAGAGATMTTTGSTSVSARDLAFVVEDLPTRSFGFMLMSQAEDLVPGFGGSQGTLCLGEPCFRFSESVQNSGVLGEVTFAPDFDALPMGQVFVEGESWNFQYWYRDANPAATSNTSGAVRVTFCR